MLIWRRIFRALIIVIATSSSSFAVAQPERKVALVIGNGSYKYQARLANPPNDAQLIADTLRSLGFELIGGKALTDISRSEFEQAIAQFGGSLRTASVGLFYYAGHGVAVRGVNFLWPIEANPNTSADVGLQLINADIVLQQMEAAGSKLNIVVLDACRSNPFSARGMRDASQGLAEMFAPRGTLISYATALGKTASDGAGRNSPYTSALAQAMRRPGLPLWKVFNEVALSVDKATRGEQRPWLSNSPIEGEFYFLPPLPVPPPAPAADPEVVFWQSVVQVNNLADYYEYLRKYPEGRFAGLARNRILVLRPAPNGPSAQGGGAGIVAGNLVPLPAAHPELTSPPPNTPRSNTEIKQASNPVAAATSLPASNPAPLPVSPPLRPVSPNSSVKSSGNPVTQQPESQNLSTLTAPRPESILSGGHVSSPPLQQTAVPFRPQTTSQSASNLKPLSSGTLIGRQEESLPVPDRPIQLALTIPKPPEGQMVGKQVESWEGTRGIWHVRATRVGGVVRGEFRCYREKNGAASWSGWGPSFEATLGEAGVFAALVSDKKGWSRRRVSGVFPAIRIQPATGNERYLDCPTGEVTLEKVPSVTLSFVPSGTSNTDATLDPAAPVWSAH